ncbi:hypothetical protein ACFYTS_34510 [Nocardia sp. NPDC004151]|uniref:hypothetical protein n=1 Tax=Nocardia sp. NPDC004151 TaxID=3364304 RepID=UPI00368AA5A1
MGARFALAHQPGMAVPLSIRRYAVSIETLAALLGAVVAGLLLMAPLDLGGATAGPVLQLDLLVLNMPRAAAAGAALAVVSAALVVALGRRSAWITACGSAVMLLVDQFWNRGAPTMDSLTTANYIDSMFAGILLGALAVAVFGKPLATAAFLIGALGSILVGDQTSLPPADGQGNPLIQLASVGTPPVWLLLLTTALLAAGIMLQQPDPAIEEETTDLAIGTILSALVVITATVLSTEWFVRHAGTLVQIGAAIAVTVGAAVLAALLLPGREGTLVLLAVAVANAGSAIIAVPRPDWTAPFPVLALLAGLAAGRARRSPWLALAVTGALAVFAAGTADLAHQYSVIPVLGVVGTGFAIGCCFGAAVPKGAGSAVVAIAVLIVPCLVVALRGSDFGRVAYSPRWYRDPTGVVSALPGWSALIVTLGCAAGVYLLWRIRPAGAAPAALLAARHADEPRNVMPRS